MIVNSINSGFFHSDVFKEGISHFEIFLWFTWENESVSWVFIIWNLNYLKFIVYNNKERNVWVCREYSEEIAEHRGTNHG